MTHAIPKATVLALAIAGLSAIGPASTTTPVADIAAWESNYINYAEPHVQRDNRPEVKGKDGIYKSPVDRAIAADRKFAAGNPLTARELARTEGKAVKTGLSPMELRKGKDKDKVQVAKLLTILVEYSATANDDFTGVMVPQSVFNDRTCVPGNIQNGPLHNNIPNPATMAHKDNNSNWVPDFSPDWYNKILYTTKGYTKRVRTDLIGPDGRKGIDISGYTMNNMYLEMSKGKYSVDGQATPWVKMPHSEAWYGANRCFMNGAGQWDAGIPQNMHGHPDNPQGPGRLATDAVSVLAQQNPSFPWADYDIEDQGDRDGDGNVFEPDGVVDHLVLVHAGEDKSGGGGAQGPYAIWAHSSAVAGGYTIPGTSLKISNYIVQPEDSGVGVFAHEYGHDLGLPDLYDTSGVGESAVDFWDLMSSGSHSGPIFQSMPTNMGIWDKWVLGWAEPKVFDPNGDSEVVLLGQSSNTPKFTQQGLKINLPNKQITLAVPHSGSNMWYSGSDQDWADVKVAHSVDVPAAGDARFWAWNNYVIEDEWDYGFIEVSTDGGANWKEHKVYDETGKLVSTDDGYADPNGRLNDYGGKKYGLTGDSHGWRHDYIDLSTYAGTTVQVRLRQATDAGFLERGWFADDFAVTGGGNTTWSDDVEGGLAGWTATGGTWTDTSGAGWHQDSGTQIKSHYYLAEWRNFDGFDKGLQYTYDTSYSNDAWKVERVKYNAPGMLLWYRDTTFGSSNQITSNLTALPSYGAKGGLLLVDSHFDPLRRTGEAATMDPTTLKNIPGRPQSSNIAFGLKKTYPFKECLETPVGSFTEYCTSFGAQPAVSSFNDATGWVPGIEFRDNKFFGRDADASVVIPSRDSKPYTTRAVHPDGSPATEVYGVDFGFTVLGTGNPGDANVSYGVRLKVIWAGWNNEFAIIQVTPATS